MKSIKRGFWAAGAVLFIGIGGSAQETTSPVSPTAPAAGQTTPAPPASTTDPTQPTAVAPAGGTRMGKPDQMTPASGATGTDSTMAPSRMGRGATLRLGKMKHHRRSRRHHKTASIAASSAATPSASNPH